MTDDGWQMADGALKGVGRGATLRASPLMFSRCSFLAGLLGFALLPVAASAQTGRSIPPGCVANTSRTPWASGRRFHGSRGSGNPLMSNIERGQRGNYPSVPTDCPQRDERLGWMGDAQVFDRTATDVADVAAFFTKWLVDVDDAQRDDEAFTDVSPGDVVSSWRVGGGPWLTLQLVVPANTTARVVLPTTNADSREGDVPAAQPEGGCLRWAGARPDRVAHRLRLLPFHVRHCQHGKEILKRRSFRSPEAPLAGLHDVHAQQEVRQRVRQDAGGQAFRADRQPVVEQPRD